MDGFVAGTWVFADGEVRTTVDAGEEAEALATRVAVLHEGRMVGSGSPIALAGPGSDLRSAYLALTGSQR